MRGQYLRGATAAAVLVLIVGTTAQAREAIRLVGSPTALRYAQEVGEAFARNTDHPPPALQVTGSGTGFNLLCRGFSFEHPDGVFSSRKITDAELATCRENGVSDLVEIEFGVDAVIVAGQGQALAIQPDTLFLALAQDVIQNGEIVSNPYQSWREIDPALPDTAIRIIIPPPASETMAGIIESVMNAGCRRLPEVAKPEDEAQRDRLCNQLRTDGALIPSGRNEAANLDQLRDDPDALAIVSFSEFYNNQSGLTAHAVAGVTPDGATLAAGNYPLLRPLYLYVKASHVKSIPGLQDFLYELTGERASGPEGYLVEDGGLVPLDDIGRNRARDKALSLSPMGANQS